LGNSSLRFALLILLLLAGGVYAQGAPSAAPNVPGNTVPTWVFYWVLGLATTAGGVLLLVIRILWDRGSEAQRATITAKEKAGALSEEEKGWLQQLYRWHKVVDDDQVPLWYIPRSWLEHINGLKSEHAAVKGLLIKLVEWNEELIADLRSQLRESHGHQVRQQTKMLKLAVRVQRAVETLANMEEPPAVETDLDDDGDDEESS